MQNSRVRLFWIWYQCVLPGYGNRSQRYMAKMHSICDTRLSINLWFYMCSYILLFTYAFLHIILSIAQICMGGIIFHRNYFFSANHLSATKCSARPGSDLSMRGHTHIILHASLREHSYAWPHVHMCCANRAKSRVIF